MSVDAPYPQPPESGRQAPRFGVGRSVGPAAPPANTDDEGFLPPEISRAEIGEAESRETERAREAGRRLAIADHMVLVARLVIWLVAGLFLIMLASWAWHFLAPAAWHYLSAGQIDKLQNNLIVAILSGVVAVSARRYL